MLESGCTHACMYSVCKTSLTLPQRTPPQDVTDWSVCQTAGGRSGAIMGVLVHHLVVLTSRTPPSALNPGLT